MPNRFADRRARFANNDGGGFAGLQALRDRFANMGGQDGAGFAGLQALRDRLTSLGHQAWGGGQNWGGQDWSNPSQAWRDRLTAAGWTPPAATPTTPTETPTTSAFTPTPEQIAATQTAAEEAAAANNVEIAPPPPPPPSYRHERGGDPAPGNRGGRGGGDPAPGGRGVTTQAAPVYQYPGQSWQDYMGQTDPTWGRAAGMTRDSPYYQPPVNDPFYATAVPPQIYDYGAVGYPASIYDPAHVYNPGSTLGIPVPGDMTYYTGPNGPNSVYNIPGYDNRSRDELGQIYNNGYDNRSRDELGQIGSTLGIPVAGDTTYYTGVGGPNSVYGSPAYNPRVATGYPPGGLGTRVPGDTTYYTGVNGPNSVYGRGYASGGYVDDVQDPFSSNVADQVSGIKNLSALRRAGMSPPRGGAGMMRMGIPTGSPSIPQQKNEGMDLVNQMRSISGRRSGSGNKINWGKLFGASDGDPLDLSPPEVETGATGGRMGMNSLVNDIMLRRAGYARGGAAGPVDGDTFGRSDRVKKKFPRGFS